MKACQQAEIVAARHCMAGCPPCVLSTWQRRAPLLRRRCARATPDARVRWLSGSVSAASGSVSAAYRRRPLGQSRLATATDGGGASGADSRRRAARLRGARGAAMPCQPLQLRPAARYVTRAAERNNGPKIRALRATESEGVRCARKLPTDQEARRAPSLSPRFVSERDAAALFRSLWHHPR